MLRLGSGDEGIGLGVLALFTSIGTLLCCALPILLVSLGFGSVVAAVTLQLPILVTLADYKVAMFVVSGLLLMLSAWFLWRGTRCPADPAMAARCQRTNRWGRRIFWLASSFWLVDLTASYLLLPLRQWLAP